MFNLHRCRDFVLQAWVADVWVLQEQGSKLDSLIKLWKDTLVGWPVRVLGYDRESETWHVILKSGQLVFEEVKEVKTYRACSL